MSDYQEKLKKASDLLDRRLLIAEQFGRNDQKEQEDRAWEAYDQEVARIEAEHSGQEILTISVCRELRWNSGQ